MGAKLKTAYEAALKSGILASTVRVAKADRVNFAGSSGGQASPPVTWAEFSSKVTPCGESQEFVRCRKIFEQNLFVSTLIQLKMSFCNYDFKVLPAKKLEEAEQAKFQKWHEANIQMAETHAEEVWRDYLVCRNAVSYWKDSLPAGVGALVLDLERCDYSDRMGIERLKYTHGLTAEDRAKLDAVERKRYESPSVELQKNGEDEGYRVLRQAKKGHGFGRPDMVAIFREDSTLESMEVGEVLMGFYNRTIVRFHRLGYEIKQGALAGSPKQHWKKERWDEIDKFFRKNQGAVETSGNFDHKIEFPHPPVEYFNDKKWEGLQRRFIWWAGPLGWMLVAKSISPFLMDLLRTQVAGERKRVGRHLSEVIGEAFNAPVPIKVTWGNKCFRDPRLAAEMMKWAVQQGPLSTRTAIEELDYNWNEEQERKKAEAELPDGQIEPRFDQNHNKGEKRNGKPPGKPDKS